MTIQASKTSVFHETFTKSDNPSFLNERFTRDFHQKRQSKLPKRAFYTRLSPKVTIQASKTSVLHETFTKSDNPSFQNERFTRDFHQKMTIQASKTSVLHETSRKSELRSKHSALQIPMEQRDSTPRKHHSETANPNITATQTSHFHETLRLCSEITFFNLQVYNVRRLPRKMTFVTFLKTSKIVTSPSVWNDFDHFHAFFKIDVLPETCHKNGAFQTTLQLQIPMEQRDSTPLKHHSETANPNMTTTQTCHFHETLRLCSEMHHLSCMTYHFYANHNGIAAQTDTRHVHEKSLFGALPNGRAIGAGFEHLRTVADGCGRLRTRKQRPANTALPSDSQS